MASSPRMPLIVGNWKMHTTQAEALALVRALGASLAGVRGVEAGVCPPFVHLAALREPARRAGLMLGAQDLFWETKGAFTGEISAAMLTDAGCTHVIVGHSERRHVLMESDAWVARKLRAALQGGLTPILCVGEKLEEREAGRTAEVVTRQVRSALEGLKPEEIGRIVVAYEPVWAIGTGRNATPDQAQEVHRMIRGLLAESAGVAVAGRIRIQYGGSVKPENVDALMAQPDVDGALVGGASLEAASFAKIVRGGVRN